MLIAQTLRMIFPSHHHKTFIAKAMMMATTLTLRFSSAVVRRGTRSASTLLFGSPVDIRGDAEPRSGFDAAATFVKKECEILRGQLRADDSLNVAERLDKVDSISNAVCSVIDAAELCRHVHPEESYRNAAEECYANLSGYIQELNADTAIYKTVKRAHDACVDGKVTLSEEHARFAELNKIEFESHGIHLCDDDRQRLGDLEVSLDRLCRQYEVNIARASQSNVISVPNPHSKILGNVRIPASMQSFHWAMATYDDETIREQVYRQYHSGCPENESVLASILKTRNIIAGLAGFRNHADRALRSTMSMLSSVKEVSEFIDDSVEALRPRVDCEHAALEDAKRRCTGEPAAALRPWDVIHYQRVVRAEEAAENQTSPENLAEYFSISCVVNGFQILCRRLFNIDMTREELGEGESWHPSIEKYAFRHPSEGYLGEIYLDLFPRDEKYTHPSHFTVRCGSANSGQTPIVALVCCFSSGQLSHREMEALFHEFGHALHSLLSRTWTQHLSGTRTVPDFVEVPSLLMEFFCRDHRVVREFAAHARTGERIPELAFTNCMSASERFRGIDAMEQLFLARLDLELHCRESQHDALLAAHEATRAEYVKGTKRHTTFGHLTTYGASYYAYSYCRKIAEELWQGCFQADPFSSNSGTKLWREILMPGGGRDPQTCLQNAMGVG